MYNVDTKRKLFRKRLTSSMENNSNKRKIRQHCEFRRGKTKCIAFKRWPKTLIEMNHIPMTHKQILSSKSIIGNFKKISSDD